MNRKCDKILGYKEVETESVLTSAPLSGAWV